MKIKFRARDILLLFPFSEMPLDLISKQCKVTEAQRMHRELHVRTTGYNKMTINEVIKRNASMMSGKKNEQKKPNLKNYGIKT